MEQVNWMYSISFSSSYSFLCSNVLGYMKHISHIYFNFNPEYVAQNETNEAKILMRKFIMKEFIYGVLLLPCISVLRLVRWQENENILHAIWRCSKNTQKCFIKILVQLLYDFSISPSFNLEKQNCWWNIFSWNT